MTEPRWKSPFPSEVTEVRLLAAPRRAVVSIAWGTSAVDLHLTDPRPLAALCEALDSAEILVFSRNDEEHGHLELGQFRVELWDEDGRIGAVECDSFEVQTRPDADEPAAAAEGGDRRSQSPVSVGRPADQPQNAPDGAGPRNHG